MWHLFKTKRGFEIALIFRGRYIVGSNQGYKTRNGCHKALKCIIPSLGVPTSIKFQDDTLKTPMVFSISRNESPEWEQNINPSKPYQPK